MTTPLDPMMQYDPGSAAFIAQQTSPQHRVAQALMQQQGGGMGALGQPALQAMMLAKQRQSQGLLRQPPPDMSMNYEQLPYQTP